MTTRHLLIAACVMAAAVGGCGDTAATIRALTPDSVILAFGDSLTSGKGTAGDGSYPSVLSGLTDCKVVNGGRPGELSVAGLKRLPSMLEKYKPDLVILCHGGNDMLRKRDQAETERNLDLMIGMIKKAGADVILIGVPEPGIFLNTAAFYEDLARKHGIPYDGQSIGEILSNAALKSDYIHPNANGYRKLAESVASLIHESQAS